MDEFDIIDEVMLPGFRFHPTDEEIVGFYLTRKIQQKSLSIELIKQLDIYKFDPWDLSKFATSGEKEWYFYCPRERKYRNSVRPNRVTGAGFWKATGTDRPIYSSGSITKCIGLKKSLVFYKGKASKGIKTDWMMHEFRLPTLSDSPSHTRVFDKNIPANVSKSLNIVATFARFFPGEDTISSANILQEAWAICRIFKKAKSKQRAVSQYSWALPVFDSTTVSNITNLQTINSAHFSSNNLIIENTNTSHPQFGFHNDIPEHSSIAMSTSPHLYQVGNGPVSTSPSILGSESVDFSMFHDQCDGFSTILSENMQGNFCVDEKTVEQSDDQFGALMCMGFGYSFPLSSPSDAWNSSLLWDSSPCISDLSTNFCTK